MLKTTHTHTQTNFRLYIRDNWNLKYLNMILIFSMTMSNSKILHFNLLCTLHIIQTQTLTLFHRIQTWVFSNQLHLIEATTWTAWPDSCTRLMSSRLEQWFPTFCESTIANSDCAPDLANCRHLGYFSNHLATNIFLWRLGNLATFWATFWKLLKKTCLNRFLV